MDGCTRKGTSKSSNATFIRQAISSFLKGLKFADLKRHGNSAWDPFLLVAQAILWRMSFEPNVTDAHEDAQENCRQLFGDCGARSYQSLMGALLAHSSELISRLRSHLQVQMAQDLNSRIAGYFVLAIDGSKPSAPRTHANEKRFVSQQYGKGKGARSRRRKRKKKKVGRQARVSHPVPNVLLTKFWNVALQLPWHWTVGDAGTSEQQEAADGVKKLDFPPETLLVGDAAFVGYQLWQQILSKNLTFLIRAGSNVYLKQKNTGRNLYYYLPNRFSSQCPIVVRLVYIKVGKRKMAMLTNELEPARLAKRTLRKLYELRWGVEVDFRDFKQTFDCRKFRCKSPNRVIVEAEWSMLAFTLIKWWTYRHQSQSDDDWTRASFTRALKAHRRALSNHNNVDPPRQTLRQELREAVLDGYKRNSIKTARYRPVGEKPATGLPIIQQITKQQRQKLENALRAAKK